jgi:beta-lactamase regulating signal transducer with metallopeptidase domain
MLAFIAAAVGGASSLWDVVRTRALLRRFHEAGFRHEPRLVAITRRLEGGARVYVVRDPVPYALTAGLWRPAVFLSTGSIEILDDDELEAVVRHELAHARRRDPLRILLGRALRRALFFVPVARDLWIRYVVASELTADASAVAAQGRYPLSRALLRLLPAATETSAERLPGFGPMSDARVIHLLQPASVQLPAVGRTRLALSAAMVLAVLGAVPMHAPPSFFDVLAHLGLTC